MAWAWACNWKRRRLWRKESEVNITGTERGGISKRRWFDNVGVYLRKEGLSRGEVHDQTAWIRLSSHIDHK